LKNEEDIQRLEDEYHEAFKEDNGIIIQAKFNSEQDGFERKPMTFDIENNCNRPTIDDVIRINKLGEENGIF